MRGIATFAVMVVGLGTTAFAAQSHHTPSYAHSIAHHARRMTKPKDDVPPPAGHGKVAPADEYFGRLKMSVLGIRNELGHLQSQVENSTGSNENVMGTAALVEDAIKDWEQHYPGDPWLAKNVYLLTHLYAKVHSDDGHAHAMRGVQWLMAKYQASGFAERAMSEVTPSSSQPAQAPQR